MTIAGKDFEWPPGFSTWLEIASKLIAAIAFLVILGSWIGPVRETPAKVVVLESRVRELEWARDQLQKQATQLEQRQTDSADDRQRIHVAIKEAENIASEVKSNALMRIEFVEWKAALESRNKNLSAPPLIIKENR